MPDKFTYLVRLTGKSRQEIIGILPDWWDDAVLDTPAGWCEACVIISRALNIPIRHLLEANPHT